MERKELKDYDIYDKLKKNNFEFFKLFFELYNKEIPEDLKDCNYIKNSRKKQAEIIEDLKNYNINYDILNKLLD